MANPSTPYIAKQAAPLVNPTTATIFTQALNPLATIAANQVVQAAYVKYAAYAAGIGFSGSASGVSNNQNLMWIRITAAGRATGGTTTNFTPSLYLGRTLGAANVPGATSTLVASMTATAFNTASGNWVLNASLLWDAVSGQLNGTISGVAGSGGAQTILAPTTITPITGLTLANPAINVTANYSTGELPFFFSIGGLFSASNTANVANLDLFQSEEL